MIIEKRYFSGGINADDSPSAEGIPPPFLDRHSLNLMNCRFGVSEYGRDGRLENTPGSTSVSQSAYPPYGTQMRLGSCVDAENGWLLYFLYNTHGDHGIYCYDFASGVIYPVLYDSQVEGGLGFSRTHLIHSARTANGILYWTDNLNHPRRVNVKAGINANRTGTFAGVTPYVVPANLDVITIIRKPPNYALAVEKEVQVSPALANNFIALFSGKFAAYYDFRDGEKSVLSSYSPLVPYNIASDSYNRVNVTFSFAEIIPQDAERVNLCVQYGNDPNFFTIKTWDKNNTTDNAEINAHNAGTTQLTYAFLNAQAGIGLSSDFSVKPFDSVPLTSEGLEILKNRIFLANNLEGYDTPTTTSLAATLLDLSEGAGVTGLVWTLVYNSGGNTVYVIYISGIGASSGYYRVTANDTVFPSNPTAWASLTFISSSTTDVFRYYVPTWPTDPITSFTSTGTFISITGAPTPVNLVGATCYKSGSPYKIAIVFFDRWMRKCGIVKNGATYQTADRTYSAISYTVGIDWTLSNANAVNEIPDWAEYYCVVRTKNLRTNFFMQARSKNTTSSMSYATKDVNGDYAFATQSAAATNAGVGIDVTNFENFGMGYTFNEGDIVKVYISGDSTVYTLKIIAQDGRWIVAENRNLGTLNTSTNAFFEIYTPRLESTNEAYYELGEVFAINNAGASNRTYSVLGGSLRGDVTLLSRNVTPNNYLTENMSPNDTYWRDWFTDAGRPNFVDTIGQQQKKTEIAYSNVLLSGTRTNGLSTFDALDRERVQQDCGTIRKLKAANKVTDEQGNVMLAICEIQTVSLYLGEVQLVGQSSNAFVAQATNVIGTQNVLKNSHGTIHPETVVEYLGIVFFLDARKGTVVQYSNNGLDDINFKMQRFFQRYCKEYLAASTNNLDNINGFHHISFGIDPFTEELLITLPALIYENYATTFSSYTSVPSNATSIINRFDIYDQLGKTMTYKWGENKWNPNWEYKAEGFETMFNKLFAWKSGVLYIMNSDTTNWNRFFGTNYPMRICVTGNLNPSALKELCGIAIEGNAIPNFTIGYADYPNVQVTDLAAENYTNQQGVMYATFLRDRLSPNASGTADQKMFEGDPITDVVLKVMCEFQQYSSLVYINFVDISYNISTGQKAITNPINS